MIGVAAAAPAELGTHHSVYASGGESDRAVYAYLHKPTLTELGEASAISSDGTVQIDTGLVWLDAPTVGKLAGLAQTLATSGAIGDDANVSTFERLNVGPSRRFRLQLLRRPAPSTGRHHHLRQLSVGRQR